MKFVIQRCQEASVSVDGKTVGAIEKGLMVLIGGQLLLVSQFTLYANCRHGNRPSFTDAGDPQKAEELYEYLIERAKEQVSVVEQGIFGADMKVALVNDGPFTIILDEAAFA